MPGNRVIRLERRKTRAALASRVFTSVQYTILWLPLDDAAARDQASDHDHDRDDEQNMDQPAGDVKHAEAENPQNEENNRKCPKHCPNPRSRVSATPNR